MQGVKYTWGYIPLIAGCEVHITLNAGCEVHIPLNAECEVHIPLNAGCEVHMACSMKATLVCMRLSGFCMARSTTEKPSLATKISWPRGTSLVKPKICNYKLKHNN